MITPTNFLELSQSEKNSILLMHESLFPRKRVITQEEFTIDNAMVELKKELTFHKQIHSAYISNVSLEVGISYINNIREEYISNLFDNNQTIIENYSSNFKNLIVESPLDLLTEIHNFNEFLIESFDYKLQMLLEDNWLSNAWNKTKSAVSGAWDATKSAVQKGATWVKDKVQSGLTWLKEKGIDWLFEGLRKGLYSWGGAAVQAFLAGPWTYGVGNIVLVTVWGAMLLYDLYLGFAKGEWGWANIIIDVVAILTTGPGGKIVHGIFKGLGLLGKGVPLKTVLQKAMNSKSAGWFGNMMKSVVQGIGKIGKVMLDGANWVATKLGFTSIKNWIPKAQASLQNFVSSITQTTASQGAKQVTQKVAQKGGQKVAQKAGQKVAQKAGTMNPTLKQNLTGLGNVALAGGLTYGLNRKLGGDTRMFGGAFVNDDEELLASMEGQQATYSDEDLP